MENIRVFRMSNGVEFVAQQTAYDNGVYTVTDPLQFMTQRVEEDKVALIPKPLMLFGLNKEISFQEAHVMFIDDPQPEIVKAYTDIVSPIAQPSKEIILPG